MASTNRAGYVAVALIFLHVNRAIGITVTGNEQFFANNQYRETQPSPAIAPRGERKITLDIIAATVLNFSHDKHDLCSWKSHKGFQFIVLTQIQRPCWPPSFAPTKCRDRGSVRGAHLHDAPARAAQTYRFMRTRRRWSPNNPSGKYRCSIRRYASSTFSSATYGGAGSATCWNPLTCFNVKCGRKSRLNVRAMFPNHLSAVRRIGYSPYSSARLVIRNGSRSHAR